MKELAEYRQKSEAYLKQHPKCEVKECGKAATHIHHKAGRENGLLNEVEYFMAVCNQCHPMKIHYTNVKWAKENGYILTGVKLKK